MSEHRLNEIVIERPRVGGGFKNPPGYKKRLQKSNYEERTKESLRRHWKEHGAYKSFSDHLAPLRRLLRSKVGQHWDDVYSELCQRLNRNSVTGQHVISHIWDFVERDVELIEGIPYRKTRGKSWAFFYNSREKAEPPLGVRGDQLYIHPENGILCLAKKPAKITPKKQDDLLVVSHFKKYQKINDIWYLVTYEDIPLMSPVTDVVSKLTVKRSPYSPEELKLYAARKRQCSKREIKFILQQLTKN